MTSHQARTVTDPRARRPFDTVLDRYRAVRKGTESLCAPLETEDCLLQSMPDASPIKWHLAHSTWFFETFVLSTHAPDYQVYHPTFSYLFNSYYNAIGTRWPRAQRGLVSRPSVAEVFNYRAHVDAHIAELLETTTTTNGRLDDLESVLELGLNHEQQHQELILTDIKHAFSLNPLDPAYHHGGGIAGSKPAFQWVPFQRRLALIGKEGAGFAFDNESPRHQAFVRDFQLANRPVTNREYLEFVNDNGYARPEYWLSDGWAARDTHQWRAPLYWEQECNAWTTFTLNGRQPLQADEPVCHLSYYEADAFARWAGARLPTEAEWEIAADTSSVSGHFLESKNYHPAAPAADDDQGPLFKMYGDVWQWTASPYVAYPGYVALTGALGEYNGKFMCNQMVLRGASCATPRSHARLTYRNFFPPEARWQFSGIRLAKDL